MTVAMLVFGAVLEIASPQAASAAEQLCVREQDAALQQICLGNVATAHADKLAKESPERTHELKAAAEHYKSAVSFTTQSTLKIDALKLLATCYDERHLHELAQLESALQEWMRLAPTDLSPVYRLAQAQEDDGLIDIAEQTLLDVRHQHPDIVEPNTMLMQFYARRVAAVRQEKAQSDRQDDTPANERDANGVYRVGGSIAKPQQQNLGLYQPELISDTPGQVVAEITIDASGTVISGKVVRSDSALLDEAALQAVRNWRFQPTAVNGQDVPVKMNVTVTFVPPQSRQ